MSNSDIQESPSDTKATANVLLSIAASDNNRTSNDNDDSVSLSPSNDNNSDDENKSDESDDENQSDENNNQSDDHSDSSNDEKQDKETPFIVQEEEHCVDDKPTDESPSVVDENENIDEEVEVTSFLPSSLKANEIPNKFIFYKNWDYPNVNGSEFNSDDQIKTISYLVFLRGLVYDRTMKKTKHGQKSHELGYRIPLHDLIADDDRPQIKNLANKFYTEKRKRIKNVWLYYYPATADVPHDHLKNFLIFNFPTRGEEQFIGAVLNHKNTEALCIAIHDDLHEDADIGRSMSSTIIASSVFRMLKGNEESGTFVFYLSALQEKLFSDIAESKSFQNMRCPIEGHGLGEMLLRNTQLFCKGVRQTYNLFLAVNKSSDVLSYYQKLGFHQHKSWTDISSELQDEVTDCGLLESGSIDIYYLMSKQSEMHTTNLSTVLYPVFKPITGFFQVKKKLCTYIVLR